VSSEKGVKLLSM